MQLSKLENIKPKIFQITNSEEFNTYALSVFQIQFTHNPIYNKYCNLIGYKPDAITHFSEIPCMPIEFFKKHVITTGDFSSQLIFESSGTTGSETSKHHIADTTIYNQSILSNFTQTYGQPKDICILALLPSYKIQSSLVYMAKLLIAESRFKQSDFYTDLNQLSEIIHSNQQQQIPTLLIGVSFALLNLINSYTFSFPELIVMETGGMKGQQKELTRMELHAKLTNGFGVTHIHSEYGMTELLSQAYAKQNGLFSTPAWMKILIRDLHDPNTLLPTNKRGGINIIDLANIYSCAFIATQDLGVLYENNQFEVLGRIDNSDIRGCNLLFNY